MKTSQLFRNLAPLVSLFPALNADPVLLTPGSATWETLTTAGGTETIFTVTGDTVLDWSTLHVAEGSSLIFNVLGGEGVFNQLGGGQTHRIDGAVVSSGPIGFFAADGDIEINGSISAPEVTVATLGAEASEFFGGGDMRLENGGFFRFLTVEGTISATAGDVVLAGENIIIGSEAELQATRAVRIAGTDAVTLRGDGGQRLVDEGPEGFVLHLGKTSAPRIEVSAGREISNQGHLGSGSARVFLEVGDGGSIVNESSGLIVDDAVFEGNLIRGERFGMDDADAPAVMSESTVRLPALRRPDGSVVSKSKIVRTSVAVSASISGSDRGDGSRRQPATVAKRSEGRSLMTMNSFFGSGMRGGRVKREEEKDR